MYIVDRKPGMWSERIGQFIWNRSPEPGKVQMSGGTDFPTMGRCAQAAAVLLLSCEYLAR